MEKTVVEMTEKQKCVIDCLYKDVDMPTKKIMQEVSDMWEADDDNRLTVSERYVQRIRKWYKWYKANNENVKEKDMSKGDVVYTTGAKEWQIDLINAANEGDYTVQELGRRFNVQDHEVRNSLIEFQSLVKNIIMDESNNNVFFPFTNDDTPIFPANNPEIPDNIIDPIPAVNDSATGEDYWEVDIDCVDSCGKVEKEVDVFLSRKSREKSTLYMKWAGACEWLAYLVGFKDDKGFHVTDLYLPDQKTSSVLVSKVVAEEYNKMQVIGVIHSHHEMGAGDEDRPSFSGHDANFINGNHDLSLLAGRSPSGFKIVGIGRSKTPCGALMQVKACIKREIEKLPENEEDMKREFVNKCMDGSIKKENKYFVHSSS